MRSITRASAISDVQAAEPARSGGEVSLVRLYLLRATYALVFVGLANDIWPAIAAHVEGKPWELRQGIIICVFFAVSTTAAFGIRYPLQMLPLILFDLMWKALWLVLVALPLWQAGQIDAATADTVFAAGMGAVIFPIAIPWGYVVRHYLLKPGDRWW